MPQLDQALDKAPGRTALLLIDVINGLNFQGSDQLEAAVLRIADTVVALRDAADVAHVPVVYVNDNYGQWHSERTRLIKQIENSAPERTGLIQRFLPHDTDYFIIKPQFSGFYATNLPVLLPMLGVNRLIMAGWATDICVLFTAADAHMRDYELWVPCDAVASEDGRRTRWALEIMRNSMDAETCATTELTLDNWIGRAR